MNVNLRAQLVEAPPPTPRARKLAYVRRPEGKLRGTGVRVNKSVSRIERRIQESNEAAPDFYSSGQWQTAGVPPPLTVSYRDAANNEWKPCVPPRAPRPPSRFANVHRRSWPQVSESALKRDLRAHKPWRGEHTFKYQCPYPPEAPVPSVQEASIMSPAVRAHIQSMQKWLFIERFWFCTVHEKTYTLFLSTTRLPTSPVPGPIPRAWSTIGRSWCHECE